MAKIKYPKLWKWARGDLRPLSEWSSAPDAFGFYEIGQLSDGVFIARYCGRAAGTTLRQRLSKQLCAFDAADIRGGHRQFTGRATGELAGEHRQSGEMIGGNAKCVVESRRVVDIQRHDARQSRGFEHLRHIARIDRVS